MADQNSSTKMLKINSSLIAELKYLSDTDNCQCPEDMQRSLEEIFDILEEKFPEIAQP